MEKLRGIITTQNSSLYTKLLKNIYVGVLNLIIQLSGDSYLDQILNLKELTVIGFGGDVWFIWKSYTKIVLR